MEITGQAKRLRIYISTTDKTGHTLLSEYLVNMAYEQGMAGVTVTKGIIGYGASSVIHSYKFWEISDKLPAIVEVIDNETKISEYYHSVSELFNSMRYGCLVTCEVVDILLYKAGEKKL